MLSGFLFWPLFDVATMVKIYVIRKTLSINTLRKRSRRKM